MFRSSSSKLSFGFFTFAALVLLLLSACEEKPFDLGRPLTDSEQRGQRLYTQTCRNCHFADSTRPLSGPSLAGVFRKPFLPSGRPANNDIMKQTIYAGRNNMPNYKGVFTDGQMNDLLAYLHTL